VHACAFVLIHTTYNAEARLCLDFYKPFDAIELMIVRFTN